MKLHSLLRAAIPIDDFDISTIDPDWSMIAEYDYGNWARWVPTEIREVWPMLSLESKMVAVTLAWHIADAKIMVAD